MILYHGSNCDVTIPDLKRGRRGLDFGQGFYLTPDMNSARSMAGNAVRREGCGCRTINVYEFDETTARDAGLSIRCFPEMNLEWMTFVIANRVSDRNAVDHNLDSLYDVVSGCIADDRIQALIRTYCAGMTTVEQILKVLLDRPWRVLQYSFHSKRALRHLRLKEVWHEC